MTYSWFIDDVRVIATDTTDVNVGEMMLSDNSVNLYPNPVKDQLHIVSKTMIRQMVLLAANGVIVENKKVDDYTLDYTLEGYSKGVYVLRLVTDSGVITKKVVLSE